MPVINSYRYGVSFNPVTAISWTACYWAEGADFAANGGGGDASAVGTWHDEIGTYDATQATGSAKPTYRTTGGPNSTPSLDFDGGDILTNTNAAFDMASPFSVVVIGNWDNPAGDGIAVASGADEFYMGSISNVWTVAGTTSATADDASAHLFVGCVLAGSDQADVDGTQIIGVDFVAPYWNNGIQIGGAFGGYKWDGDICFIGVYDSGDVRSDGQWANFKSWVTSHYGITVA